MTDKKWQNGDSARKMTQKFNALVDSVESLIDSIDKISELEKYVRETKQEVQDKLDSLSKADVGLDNVDNTSDEDKPVSTPQAQAIKWAKEEAMEDMLTSQPVSDELVGDDTSFVANVSVQGTKLSVTV